MFLMFFNLWARFLYFLSDFFLYLVITIVSFGASFLFVSKIFKSQFPDRRKKILLSLVALFFIFVLIFSSFEAYFRYVYDEPDGLGFLKVNDRWHKRHVVFNSYFFRDRDFNPVKKEGLTRIGIIGDSITFGGGIENPDDRFSNLLERKLKDNNYNVEVYNLGKSGYDTEGEIKAYETVKHLNFDIIIWQYFLNDIQPETSQDAVTILSRNSKRNYIIKFLQDQSYFFDFIYWRFSQKYQKTFQELKTADLNQYSNEQVLTNHKKEISNFISDLRKDDKEVIVVLFPFLYLLGGDYPSQVHLDMANYFRENETEVIDLRDYLKDNDPKTLMAGKFDPHPNEYVHKITAEKLFEKLVPLLK